MPGLHTAFFAASALLFTAGLVIALLALFRDRARGRARCPRCWYDMSGAPVLTCPECGHTAKSVRQLRRTRRRWRRAAFGMALLLLAPASSATRFKIERWNALIPTTALVAAIAVLPHDVNAETTPPPPDDFVPGKPATGLLSRASALLSTRHARKDVWGWQAAIASRIVRWRVNRTLADRVAIPAELEVFFGPSRLLDFGPNTNSLCRIKVRTRPVWPVGSHVYAIVSAIGIGDEGGTVRVCSPLEDGASRPIAEKLPTSSTLSPMDCVWAQSRLVDLGIARNPPKPAEISCEMLRRNADELDAVAFGAMTHPLRIEGTFQDILHAIPSPLFTKEARATFEARGWGDRSAIADRPRFITCGTVSFTISDDALARLSQSTFAARLEIRYAGTAYFRGEMIFTRPARELKGQISAVHGDNPPLTDLAGWSLRIISDPNLALRNFDCDQYWQGDVELPITLEP